MLGQTVAEIEQTSDGISIKTAEGNTFYIPCGVAVIPTYGVMTSKMIKEMSESTLAESNRRFLEHATRKYPSNIIWESNTSMDPIVANGVVGVIEFDKLSREQKAELCDEAMTAMTEPLLHICDACKLDRSTCGYIPENPQNCDGSNIPANTSGLNRMIKEYNGR